VRSREAVSAQAPQDITAGATAGAQRLLGSAGEASRAQPAHAAAARGGCGG
jgi:hypothetical protein